MNLKNLHIFEQPIGLQYYTNRIVEKKNKQRNETQTNNLLRCFS